MEKSDRKLGKVFLVFAGGIFQYQPLSWQGLEIHVPSGGKISQYSSKGWQVYFLKKLTVQIKIAQKGQVDIYELPKLEKKTVYVNRFEDADHLVYFISKIKAGDSNMYKGVLAKNINGTSIYISVSGPSLFFTQLIMGNITDKMKYKGIQQDIPKIILPTGLFGYDFLYASFFLLPLLIIFLLFNISGRKPADILAKERVILFDEENVLFSLKSKFRRQSGVCYMAITSRKLLVFIFKKPKYEFELSDKNKTIRLEKNNICINFSDNVLILKSVNMPRWQQYLNPFLG